MFQLIVTPQGIEKVMIQLKDTPSKVYAIGARPRLFLSKVFIKGRSASKLSIDPINSHASYFGKKACSRMIQLKDTPSKVCAIGAELFLSQVPLEVLQN